MKTAAQSTQAQKREGFWQSKQVPRLFDGSREEVGHQLKSVANDNTFNRVLPLRGSKTVTSPYEQMPVAYSAISEFAECVAGLKLKLWRSDPREDDEAKEVTSHPLVQLFKRPNKWMTWSRFAYAGTTHRKTCGEDLWFLIGKDGRPLQIGESGTIPLAQLGAIQPISGENADLEYDPQGHPTRWRYKTSKGSEYVVAPYWSVVAFQDYNPKLPFRGLGPLEVVGADLELEWQAIRYQDALLRHGGDPGGFLTFDGEPPSAEERQQAQMDADEAYGTQNAGKIRVAWGNKPAYHGNKVTPKDLQYLELFRLTRQRQASAIGVPLEAIGWHENATYNNITEAHREKWRKVVSYLVAVEEVINEDFLGRLDSAEARSLVARFDLSKVKALQEDQGETIERAKALAIDTGITFNEALVLLGVETKPVSGGDVALASSGVRLMEDVLAGEEEPDETDEPDSTGDGESEEQADGDRATGDVLVREAGSSPDLQAEVEDLEHREYVERRAYFKSHEEEVLEPSEKRWKKAARDILEKYQRAAIKRLRDFAENGPTALGLDGGVLARELEDDLEIPASAISASILGPVLPDAGEWAGKFYEAFSGPTDVTWQTAIRYLSHEMGVPAVPIEGGYVQEQLEQLKQVLVGRIEENLHKAIAKGIVSVFEGDGTIATLQQLIASQLSVLEPKIRTAVNVDVRALRIARTETGKAANSARHEQMRAAGTRVIEWISSGDDEVRDTPAASHKALDGTKAALGEEFTDANDNRIPHLTHPHAPGAPAAQVVNCRCAARPLPNDVNPDDE